MLPLLEIAGTARARHIARPIMIYNKLVKYAAPFDMNEEKERNGILIDTRPPYPRLHSKP